jgi:hypothetical protein
LNSNKKRNHYFHGYQLVEFITFVNVRRTNVGLKKTVWDYLAVSMVKYNSPRISRGTLYKVYFFCDTVTVV